MTPVYQVLKGITLFGLLGILASCSGSNNLARNNRTGYNGVGGNQVGGPAISPSGTYYVGNQPCNINDPPTAMTSPKNPASACSSVVPNGQTNQQQVGYAQPQPMYPQQQQVPQQQVPVQQQPQYAGVGQQQQVPGVNQGPGIFQQTANTGTQVNNEFPATYDLREGIDITPDGKIKGNPNMRYFLNMGGVGTQRTFDECFTGTGKTLQGTNLPLHQYEIGRFLHPGDDKMQLTFNSTGALIINFKTPEATLSSQGPVPYQIDMDNHTIHFGDEGADVPLRLEGKVSSDFVEHLQDEARTYKRMDDIDLKEKLDLNDDFPDDFPLAGGGTSGSSYTNVDQVVCTPATTTTATGNATVILNANGKPQKGQGAAAGISSVQPLGKTASQELADGSQVVSTGTSDGQNQVCHTIHKIGIASGGHVHNTERWDFLTGITAKFEVHPQQPLHVTSMYVEKAKFDSYAFVRTPAGPDCRPRSKAMFYHLQIK